MSEIQGDPGNTLNLPEKSRSPLEGTIASLSADVVKPHYSYVRFLTTIAGVMLTVLASQGSSSTHQSPTADLLLWLSMLCLSISLIAGALAARGEVDVMDECRRKLEDIRDKNEPMQQVKEAAKIIKVQPREFIRSSFPLQYWSGIAGVTLLLICKWLLLFPCTTSIDSPGNGKTKSHQESKRS